MNLLSISALICILLFVACDEVTPPPTIQIISTEIINPTASLTLSPTNTLTSTLLPTYTETISPTLTNTITLTPTLEFPIIKVNVQAAHCRYGPSKAFLHAADLYEGDRGSVHGRFQYSNWLYVKWDKLEYRCWVSPYVVDVTGDISQIGYANIGLERIPSTLYNPPQNVRAARNGEFVSISWDRVVMTEDDDRGYLIEAFVCQNGAYIWWTSRIDSQFTTTNAVKDDESCAFQSSGKVYTVEKHGYTDPVNIPWPP